MPVNPTTVVAAIFATGAAHMFPVPAGIGVLEGGQVWLFGMLGYPADVGLAVGLAVRLRELLWMLPGVLYLAGRYIRSPLPRLAMIIINLYALYLAVGGLAFMVSALSDRRGRVIAIVFAVLVASLLLNFLGQFWPPARRVAFLGVLHYYQPASLLGAGGFPVRDVTVLVGFAAATWSLGWLAFTRRSICTV